MDKYDLFIFPWKSRGLSKFVQILEFARRPNSFINDLQIVKPLLIPSTRITRKVSTLLFPTAVVDIQIFRLSQLLRLLLAQKSLPRKTWIMSLDTFSWQKGKAGSLMIRSISSWVGSEDDQICREGVTRLEMGCNHVV